MSAAENPVTARANARTGVSVLLLAATVFLSAFLLFQVQPIIGRYILPWFGSTPGVWATALLFFQLMLLGGYAYAHFIVSRLTWGRQAVLHVVLLGIALLTLPITPAEALKPPSADNPSLRILLILTISIGAPYILLSATAPLIQRWFARLHPDRPPYRLYALSNFGSLLALLSYPFLVEPYVRLRSQTVFWSWGFVAFAVLCGTCAFALYRARSNAGADATGEDAQPDSASALESERPRSETAVLWLLLSACGSGLLLATTNQMSMDIAIVPFLWILPLSVYLVTFILSFDHERWYVRPLFFALLPLALANAVRLLYGGVDLGIVDQLVGYSLTLFVCCMCCHGELSRARPSPKHLTFFFLLVALGGALGGLFVAILSPALFRSFYEYQLLLVACYVLVVFVLARLLLEGGESAVPGRTASGLIRLCWTIGVATVFVSAVLMLRPETWVEGADEDARVAFESWTIYIRVYGLVTAAFVLGGLEAWRRLESASPRVWWTSRGGLARVGLVGTASLGLVSLTGGLVWQISANERGTVELDRNFYGALAIEERNVGERTYRLALTHGRIHHGSQLQLYPTWPTTYYGPETGVGLAIQLHPNRADTTRQFRMGVVGLGTGTIAAYANARVDVDAGEEGYATLQRGAPDYVRFYELNPLVTDWARDGFTFLDDAMGRGADVAVFDGDARIVLERQLELGEDQRFDVLAVDAFSSDAIPIHLLTVESVDIYLAHLQDDGVLALHLTNRFVDLLPVVQRLAEARGLSVIYVENGSDPRRAVLASDWVLLTNNRGFLESDLVRADEGDMPAAGPLWTDDFSSLFGIVTNNN